MKLISNFRRLAFLAAGIVASSLILISCSKDNGDIVRQPVAGLMAYNLASDRSPVGFSISGNTFGNAPLYYTNFTGGYLPIYTGTRELRSFDFNTGSTLAISNGSFRDSGYYSVFLMGMGGKYANVVTEDRLDTLTAQSGKSWVRFVNAIPDSTSTPVVNVNAGEYMHAAGYRTVTGFTAINSGNVDLILNNEITTPLTRSITLEQNKVYTVMFIGNPAAIDTTLKPQIRFVQNGTVTP